jgi:LysR family transcriptional regulator, transcriptional activator for bauABCD operon
MLGSVSDVDIRLIRVFMTVVQCKGFAAAQSVLNVSQASISMQIAHLEERLGVRLCHRGRSGFGLTEEGKSVHEACQTLLQSLANFRSAVAFSSGQWTSRLNISVIDNSVFNSHFHLHKVIAFLKKYDKKIQIVLNILSPNEVEEAVFDGTCDLGIGYFPARRQGLDYHPLFSADMNLYCGQGHPLFPKAPNNVSLEEVLLAEHAGRAYVSNAQLPKFQRQFIVSASSPEVEGLATFVLSGQYTAYLPEHYAKHWEACDIFRKILPEELSYTSQYEMILKKGKTKGNLLNALTENLISIHKRADS